MGLDISLLETFILVADLESFSSAARRLGLTQPAVSLQIKSLEKELSAPLIDRSHSRVVLTPAGRTAYAHAKKILADRELMITEIPRATGRVAGQLLVGASNIPGEYILPPVLSEFRTIHPEVGISLDIKDSSGVIEMTRNSEIELGFTGAEPGSDMAFQRFARDRLVLITPPHHQFSTKRKVKLSLIAGQPFVNRLNGSGTRKTFESGLQARGIDPGDMTTVAELGSTQSVISAVQSGMGVAVVSNLAAEQPSRAGLIAVVELADLDHSRDFYVVNIKDRPLSMAADSFLKYVTGEQ